MQIAVLSDIHSNLEALTAALEEIERRGIDRIYCLGDVVGYGADPAACVDLVRARMAGTVLGNHDAAVAADAGIRVLPKDGQAAVKHNREQLDVDQTAFLDSLPLTLEMDGCTFVHATPEDPARWQRIGTFTSTHRQFEHFTTDVCFIGHTHIPGIVADRLGVLRMRRGHRYLVNVGSVGQPRDGDPRLSFGIFDAEAFSCEIIRLDYDVETAARKITEAGLPRRLASRLKKGL